MINNLKSISDTNNNIVNLSSSLNNDIKSYDDRLRVMDDIDGTYHIEYDDDLL